MAGFMGDPANGSTATSGEYPTSPNWSGGNLYGPTTEAAGPYPKGAYLTLAQYRNWQLRAQLAGYQVAAAAWDAQHSALGMTAANPFSLLAQEVQAELAKK